MNLPAEFLARMKERLGAEFPAFLRSYDFPPVKGLRVNTLKIPREEFLCDSPFALTPVPWEPNGFYIEEEKAGGFVEHFAGLYYLQEPSAMCAAPLLGVRRGERVLDLCAAPGGKATRLAQDLGGEGILIANEYDSARARILSENVERLGVTNCAVTNAAPAQLAERFPEYFDKILVDAPCSGEGMFKKEPNAVPEWSTENVVHCARRQAEILDCAAKMLRAGGRLVYSTCTFAYEEDEGQIEAFLKTHPQFRLMESKALYPHREKGEGHFAAVLEKTDGGARSAKPYPVRRNAQANKAFCAFAEEFLNELPKGEITTLPDGRAYLLPAGMPDLGALHVLRMGVELGEFDGKIFKPAHALAVSRKREECKRFVSLSRESAEKYLRGELLECELPNGWCAAGFGKYPLGLGKVVNGVMKNHFPKGLRKRK